jgi:hypothetical protein
MIQNDATFSTSIVKMANVTYVFYGSDLCCFSGRPGVKACVTNRQYIIYRSGI